MTGWPGGAGHSGAKLDLVVRKRAPDALSEAALCRRLGPEVCPRVIHDGFYAPIHSEDRVDPWYVAELLDPCPVTPDLPRRIEALLREKVWSRPISDGFWPEWPACHLWERDLRERLGVPVPAWLLKEVVPESYCLTHGDPTTANCAWEGPGQLRLIDPKPPGRGVPPLWQVDAGKILQSMLGWEVLIGADLEWQGKWIFSEFPGEGWEWELPDFLTGDEQTRREVLWWCGVHCLRIRQRELTQAGRKHVLDWAGVVSRICLHGADGATALSLGL